MRQLTPSDAPTGSQRLPDETSETPLTARERPRTHRRRPVVVVVTVLAALAAVCALGAAAILLGISGTTGVIGDHQPLRRDGAGPDPEQAARLVAATIPDGDAFEPELSMQIGDAGARVEMGWSPAGSSLVCDVTADPALPAERQRVAVASTSYATSQASRERTGRSERLFLAAVAMSRPAADRVLDELAAAVPACGRNPLSALRDARLGSLPNVDGVVFRARHSAATGDGPDPTVACVVVRQDLVMLRSCGLSGADGRADGLAVRGLDALRVRLEQALRDPNLPPPPAEARTPTWAQTPTLTVTRNANVPGCTMLTSEQVTAATGQQVLEFDRAACRWELQDGAVSLGPAGFGSGLVPDSRTVLHGNSALFAEPIEGECVYKIATSATAALRISVILDVPRRRPCAVARQLLGMAFDRLPPP